MDVFDLVAKIRLDSSEYENGVSKAKGTFSTLASGVKTGLATVTKVGAAAVSAGVAGVAALTKMGVEGYKSYEQLAGGAKLLWGDAYDYIAKRASESYKNVQMSQNDYLQQVNGFSVGLKTALGGNAQAAAELADRIITAEADIVAATGTSQDLVQNAFNGIMKSNFTMVDNLGLGITATKEGFQTMIDSVNAYNAAHGKSTKYQIDNVADCQAALLDYIEIQGMAGYAGMEAAETIEGSFAMMKGAWQNLVVGMADENANIGVLINNFVDSAAIAAKNLLPRIEQTLKGIGQLITKLSPVIADALPVLVASVLPSLLSAGVELTVAIVDGVITALPALYEALKKGVKTILTEVFGATEEEIGAFEDGVNRAIDTLKAAYESLCGFIDKVVSGFETAVEWGKEHETTLALIAVAVGTLTAAIVAYNVAQAIKNAGGIVELAQLASLAVGLGALTVAETAHTVCMTVGTVTMNAWNAALAFATSPITLVIAAIGLLVAAGVALYKNWDEVAAFGKKTWEGIKEAWSKCTEYLSKNTKEFCDDFGKLWSATKEELSRAWNGMKSAASDAWSGIKEAWSKCTEYLVGNTQKFCEDFGKLWSSTKENASNTWNSMKENASNAWNSMKENASSAWSGIKSAVSSKISDTVSSIANGLSNAYNTVTEKLGNIKTKFSNIWDSCKKVVSDAVAALKKALNFSWSLPKLKLPRISVSGGVAPYGIGGKGSLPKFSIEWYKKAYNRAMVLSSPTIFGMGSNGNLLGGGDGNGNEIVSGESHLMGLIGNVVESKLATQNEKIVLLLSAMLEEMSGGNSDIVRAIMADKTFKVGEREFARLVKTYA